MQANTGQFLWHEAFEIIAIPPGKDARPLQ